MAEQQVAVTIEADELSAGNLCCGIDDASQLLNKQRNVPAPGRSKTAHTDDHRAAAACITVVVSAVPALCLRQAVTRVRRHAVR